MNKKFFCIILLPLFFSFAKKTVVFTKQRKQVCSPLNSLSTGTQISKDFGKTWDICSGYTCQSGYTASNGQCVVSANVFCGRTDQWGYSGPCFVGEMARGYSQYDPYTAETTSGCGSMLIYAVHREVVHSFNCNATGINTINSITPSGYFGYYIDSNSGTLNYSSLLSNEGPQNSRIKFYKTSDCNQGVAPVVSFNKIKTISGCTQVN